MPRKPALPPPMSQFTCQLNWPSSAPAPRLHHPVTGQQLDPGWDPVTGEVQEWADETDYAAIPGLMFVYLGEICEFVWLHPAVEAQLNALREALPDDEELDDFDLLERHFAALVKVPFAYCLSTQGFACGPVSSSIWYGFDLFAPYAGFYEA